MLIYYTNILTDIKSIMSIKINKIQCTVCNDIIQSVYINDMSLCRCGSIGIDGGLDIIRRNGDFSNIIDLSEWVSDPTKISIKTNKIQCSICNDVIESEHINDFKRCLCGFNSLGGGKNYLYRQETGLYSELAEFDDTSSQT